jgi:hypothetical protein
MSDSLKTYDESLQFTEEDSLEQRAEKRYQHEAKKIAQKMKNLSLNQANKNAESIATQLVKLTRTLNIKFEDLKRKYPSRISTIESLDDNYILNDTSDTKFISYINTILGIKNNINKGRKLLIKAEAEIVKLEKNDIFSF